MTVPLSHGGVDFKHLCTDELLGVQQFLKDIDFPTPPLSPDQEVKEAGFGGSTTLLPELQPVAPADSSNLDIDTVFQIAGLGPDTEFFDKNANFYANTDLDFINPSSLSLEEPKGILQDCMWGSITYEPRNSVSGSGTGSPEVYTPAPSPEVTPAPSPPAEVKETVEEEDDGEESYSDDLSSDPSQPLRFSAEEDVDVEEIDVVTISDKPTSNQPASNRLNIRKRTSSQSAPCSRQSSPAAAVDGSFQPMKRRRSHTKRAHRLNSTGSVGDGLESDEEQKRASHNILERKRRNDLKKSYQALRNNIPELEDNQRAPKVTILRKATEFISEITVRNDDLEKKFIQEKRKEMHLLQRLSLLKSIVLKSC